MRKEDMVEELQNIFDELEDLMPGLTEQQQEIVMELAFKAVDIKACLFWETQE